MRRTRLADTNSATMAVSQFPEIKPTRPIPTDEYQDSQARTIKPIHGVEHGRARAGGGPTIGFAGMSDMMASMDQEPVTIVEAGYDVMAVQYLDCMEAAGEDLRLRFLNELQLRLDDGSDVVDLGCGAGEPCTRLLAERHSVLGVDVSATQLALAAKNAPTARLVKADFSELDLPADSVDAVTAF